MTATHGNPSTRRTVIIAAALALVLLFPLLPAPAGLPQAGMQVLGIFLGVLLLWLTVAIDWPSMLCLGALAFVPGMKMDTILSGSFGNATFAFLMFTFLCTYALSQTPFIRRCAVGFITSSMARKGPWYFSTLFFASILFLGSFISPTVLFVIYLPIIEEIYAVLGLKKGDKIASMLMMGLVFCCGISSGMTPIAHVFPLMALGYYQTATGLSIDYGAFMGFAIPVGLLAALLMMLLFRFLLNPDMSTVENLDVSALKGDTKPMDRREKTILLIFVLVVALWVVPGLVKPIAPGFYEYINAFGTALPPLLGAVALSVFTFEGKPLLPFGEAMSKGVPWGSLIMCASTLALGSAMTNKAVGLTQFLSDSIAPIAATMAPLALVLLFLAWAALQTNVSSNMVTVTVVTAIAIPICLATNGAVNTGAVCALIGILASYAFATPPAMPCVAIAGGSGWTTAGALMKYGFMMVGISVALCLGVGYPLGCWLVG